MKPIVRLSLSLTIAPFLAGTALTAAAQSDVGRWAALFAAVPPPPASLADALKGVRGSADSYMFNLEVSDPRMLDTKRQLELLKSRLWASANQTQTRLPIVPGAPMTIAPPPGPLSIAPAPAPVHVSPTITTQTLSGVAPRPAETAAPQVIAMAAYGRESFLKRQEPNQMGFHAALRAMRARYGAKHWQADQEAKGALRGQRDVARLSAELVRAHHALAAEHLSEAKIVLLQARVAMAPQVERMAELARAAEAVGASPSELKQAMIFINERLSTLYQLHEELLREAGLWAGVQPVSSPTALGDLYVHAHAPGVEVVPTLAMLYLGVWPYKFPAHPR